MAEISFHRGIHLHAIWVLLCVIIIVVQAWTPYDPTAFTECYSKPKDLLYVGGIITNPDFDEGLRGWSAMGNCILQLRHNNESGDKEGGELDYNNVFVVATNRTASYNGPSQLLPNLTRGVKYMVSAWLQVNGTSEALTSTIKATITIVTNKGREFKTVGTVLAKSGCWSFLKGGFVLENEPIESLSSRLYFETYNLTQGLEIWLDRVSVQPFTNDEWYSHQQAQKETLRRRTASLHVVDSLGKHIRGAKFELVDVKLQFNFGSAITKYFLSNPKYQDWFVKRFNTAVFGNELKWYATEVEQGKENYTTSDAMVAWCQTHNISIRGHNIVWDDPQFQQSWLKSLVNQPQLLRQALMKRLNSIVTRYAGDFLDWDVSNEQLHFSFYENALSDPNVSTNLFLATQEIDPQAQLFVNDYNTLEEPNDLRVSPDTFIAKVKQLRDAGVVKLGIGLESHFGSKPPDLAYIRATLDKLAVLGYPIWLTELDIDVQSLGNNFTKASVYLEEVLREAFSHPAVEGIMMFTSINDASGNCWRMCLTDTNMTNLPSGTAVDSLLREWLQVEMMPITSLYHHSHLHWRGPIGQHTVSIKVSENTTYYATLTVSRGHGVQHFFLQLVEEKEKRDVPT